MGSISNAHVGRDFEAIVAQTFSTEPYTLHRNFAVDIGHEPYRKAHRFDLGSDKEPILIESKGHRWTTGNNIPSAKLTVWNEAMYFFALSPAHYRKCFCVLKHARTNGETLGSYYVRNFKHLIPTGVEIWEVDEECATRERLY